MEISPGPVKSASAAIYFSHREREVLPGVIAGRGYKEIAENMGIKEKTVQAHVSSLCRRLNLRDRKELQTWCWQNPQDAKGGITRNPGLHDDDCECAGAYCTTRRGLLGIAA